VLLVATTIAAAGAAPAEAKVVSFAGQSITASDELMTGRVALNGVDASCAVPKAFPGAASVNATFRFDRHAITNDGPGTSCVDVVVDGHSCGGNSAVHGATYAPAFTGSPATGYKGDFGSVSSFDEGAKVFSYAAPPGGSELIVHSAGTSGTCTAYSAAARVAPNAVTSSPGTVSRTSARLQGMINEESEQTSFFFEFGTSPSYGSQTTNGTFDAAPDNIDRAARANANGLQPDTVYHYRIVLTYPANGGFPGRTVVGSDQTVRTAAPPTATTSPATAVALDSATLNGAVNPGGTSTVVKFEFGKTVSYGSETPFLPVGATDRTDHAVSASITGLEPDTTYHYRVVAAHGFADPAQGADATFTTPPVTPPPVTPPPPDGGGDTGPAGGAGGLVPPAPGPLGPATPVRDNVAAVFTRGLTLAPRVFRAASTGGSVARTATGGTLVAYSLSEAASLAFTVERAAPGRRTNGGCKAPTARNRKGKKCVRFVPKGIFTHTGVAGANSFRFTGRAGGKKLAPGSHRLTAVATDAAGNPSAPKRVSFKISAPKR
jgi:hypothetical protein